MRDAFQSFLKDIKTENEKKKRKKNKKRGRESDVALVTNRHLHHHVSEPTHSPLTLPRTRNKPPSIKFDHRYILAPMVGASELAFRMLCRKYGAQLCYTPMMSAAAFANEPASQDFQTVPTDRPLVCHFSANTVQDFCRAAQRAEGFCDAIDLNLGCPQRTAYVGHFGSYLLRDKHEDRLLICRMIHAATQCVKIPIFCKIRLLDTLEETIELVQQLAQAGASLIAIHARHLASWERQGPGARDGPALLDQVAAIVKSNSHGHCKIVTNGNTITWEDVEDNLQLTQADGLMSAEGILDDPALFASRYESHGHNTVLIPALPPLLKHEATGEEDGDANHKKKYRKLEKKLQRIHDLEEQAAKAEEASLEENERKLVESKDKLLKKLSKLEAMSTSPATAIGVTELLSNARDKLHLAKEYLDLVKRYPTKLRSVIFHVRRILRDDLTKYQLLEECISSDSVSSLCTLLKKLETYKRNPDSFVFDQEKAKKEKEALERKRLEEGKRKAYEARMMRKAKREGRSDLSYYLRIGAEVPTNEMVRQLKALPRREAMNIWKEKHSQHCLSFHIDAEGCKRGRGCAFLHVDVAGKHTFNETDEVAG